ncbi:MAG TPA: hypothetical protein VIB48_07670 [Acidimicrobiia bacterium]|jgi:hypothetical protein
MRSRRRVLPALTGGLCIVALAACHGSANVERLPKPHDVPRTDARARADLLAVLARGQRTMWWVDSRFVRTVGTRKLDSAVTEVNRPPDHLVAGLGGVTGTLDGHAISCTPATNGPLCSGASAPASGTPAYAALTDPTTGTYALRDARGRRIAGIVARCFDLDWLERGDTQPFGNRATACFSPGGIPLALDIERADGSDSTTAQQVRNTVTDADLAALLKPYAGAPSARPVTPSGPTTTTTVAPAVPGG